MSKIAVISTGKTINTKIKEYCEHSKSELRPVFFRNKEKCLSYLKYELPEIIILNFVHTSIDIEKIIVEIKEDPWLHYEGIIIIQNPGKENGINKHLQGLNIISIINKNEFDFSFPRLLRILNQNKQIIFQREIQNQLLKNISGSFIIDNDPFDIKTYSNLITNYLYNSNFIDLESKNNLMITLMELLMNAIEHGNCCVSYHEKTKWLESGKDMFELIRKKNKNTKIKKKKVFFSYKISPKESSYKIQDEGEGFDWKKFIKSNKNNFTAHGHGIKMSNYYVNDLNYNKSGNEVAFKITHQENQTNSLPVFFKKHNEIVLKNNQIVFKEGEESNYLYYIVSGKFNIEYNKKVLSTLTPDDIFLGEMSFLRDNKRSATVRSIGKSILLKISKESFINAIKEKPYYGLFLARLLAQRLANVNELVK